MTSRIDPWSAYEFKLKSTCDFLKVIPHYFLFRLLLDSVLFPNCNCFISSCEVSRIQRGGNAALPLWVLIWAPTLLSLKWSHRREWAKSCLWKIMCATSHSKTEKLKSWKYEENLIFKNSFYNFWNTFFSSLVTKENIIVWSSIST